MTGNIVLAIVETNKLVLVSLIIEDVAGRTVFEIAYNSIWNEKLSSVSILPQICNTYFVFEAAGAWNMGDPEQAWMHPIDSTKKTSVLRICFKNGQLQIS